MTTERNDDGKVAQAEAAKRTESDKGWVRLNVGGERFTVHRDTLTAFPDTLLGRMFADPLEDGTPSTAASALTKPCDDGTYRFDRSPRIFRTILQFYRSGGQLSIPANISRRDVFQELQFFQIPTYRPGSAAHAVHRRLHANGLTTQQRSACSRLASMVVELAEERVASLPRSDGVDCSLIVVPMLPKCPKKGLTRSQQRRADVVGRWLNQPSGLFVRRNFFQPWLCSWLETQRPNVQLPLGLDPEAWDALCEKMEDSEPSDGGDQLRWLRDALRAYVSEGQFRRDLSALNDLGAYPDPEQLADRAAARTAIATELSAEHGFDLEWRLYNYDPQKTFACAAASSLLYCREWAEAHAVPPPLATPALCRRWFLVVRWDCETWACDGDGELHVEPTRGRDLVFGNMRRLL
ncbi:BTB/POZ domain-containing protein [uncultured virus]|nr:BTB/POZ domain-containing protein [uncultured virus]